MSIKVTNNFNTKMVENKVRSAIGLYADTAAKKMEGEAKGNAPWTDRTSNARNSIRGDFGWKGKHAVISLSGNMNYSVYLELAHEKRFAILVPTIQKNAPEVIKGYQRLVK
ncbi:hypothetical protein [Proteiniborus sp.]|uniref:hypothetical protein n=1 Tax=Proteiniborus sp. TaxID=2079015 RepID=UPI003319AF1D